MKARTKARTSHLPPSTLEKLVSDGSDNTLRYSVAGATLVATDPYFEKGVADPRGGNRFLYQTPRGNFFTVEVTPQCPQGSLTPVSLASAHDLFIGELSAGRVPYEKLFPGLHIVDA